MSSKAVYDAVKARLVAELGGSYPVRDWEEIEVALQQGVAPWISLEDSGGTNALNSIGAPAENWVTDEGYIDIHVFTPSTGSLDATRAIAAQVRDVMFYKYLDVSVGTCRVLTVDPPDTSFIHDGLWHSLRVTLNYSHQYTRATAA